MTKELTLNKVAAALVGVAMVAGLAFAFTASRAHAVTLSELVELFIALDVIPADKADEARAVLAGQEETTSAPAAMSCNFTRNLTVGDTGADVMDLQKLLNANGFTVAASGAGSAGAETEYYGPATAAAVTAMQNAFASEILTPLGLTSGTGYFGASTRAKANSLCSAAQTTPTTPSVPSVPTVPTVPGDVTGDTGTTLSGSEASLESLKRLGAPASVTVSEDETRAKVAGWKFDVKDADASLRRVDVNFEANGGSSGYSKKPYEYFDSVSLYLNGDKIAERDANSRSDWGDLAGDVWQMRFSGLDELLAEDETPELVVAVSTVGNLDNEDENTTWNVFLADNGVRARDGAGIDQYIGDSDTLSGASLARTFKTESASASDELKVSLASSNPASSIIKVDDDTTTQDVTILSFDMKAKGHDVSLDTVPMTFTISSTTINLEDMVTNITLDIDGQLFNDYTIGATTSAGVWPVTFDEIDEDAVINKDDTVNAKVIIDLNSLTGNYDEGDTVTASLTSANVDAITGMAGDDLNATINSGSAVGEAQQLQSQGIFGEIVSIDEASKSNGTDDDTVGEFKFKVDVTAFDDTFYVSATTTSILGYTVFQDSSPISTTSPSVAISSTATKENSAAYRINDGGTETFTITVTFEPGVAGNYKVRLDSLDYGSSATDTTDQTAHTLAPTEDFESDDLYLNA